MEEEMELGRRWPREEMGPGRRCSLRRRWAWGEDGAKEKMFFNEKTSPWGWIIVEEKVRLGMIP